MWRLHRCSRRLQSCRADERFLEKQLVGVNLRSLVRGLDKGIRSFSGVFEFSNDPHCLLRVSLGRARHELSLPNEKIKLDTPILEIHLWNEHLPMIPVAGADFGWALKTFHMFRESLVAVASLAQTDPRATNVEAIGGANALLLPGSTYGGEGLMKRLGFTVLPYHRPLGRLGEFWENFYSWLLIWTFNPVSLRGHQLLRLRRSEIWMSREEFLRRYGDKVPRFQ